MKSIYVILILLLTFNLNAEYQESKNIFTEVTNFYHKGEIDKALLKAEEILTNSIKTKGKNDYHVAVLGDLADLYIRLSIKQKKDPIPFLINIVKAKIDYLVSERIALAIADYYFKQGITRYYSSLYFYSWIKKNHVKKSLVYDDALWSSFLIYKKIKAYKHAIKELREIIGTETYSIYVGSYNQTHLYDAYLEKANIEYYQLKDRKEAIKTLKRYLNTYKENDTVDDAMFLLCKIGQDNKNKTLQQKCCDLVKNYPYSSLKKDAEKICNEIK